MLSTSFYQNPRNYYEDGIRAIPAIRNTPNYPLVHAANTIDAQSLLPLSPSPARVTSWTQLTDMPFDLPHTTGVNEVALVPCPACPNVKPVSVLWITGNKTGYAQTEFAAVCPYCSITFNREVCPLQAVYFAQSLRT